MERVDILDPVSLTQVDQCYGPTTSGRCARVRRDGVVACAGYRVAPTDAGPSYWHLWVPPDSRQCPLAYNLDVVGY